jgi:hypothetical protein
VTEVQKQGGIDQLSESMVLKELMPDEKLLFARLEDPVPRMMTMTKALLAVVLLVIGFDIYVKHHQPPTLGNAILFVMVWLCFLLLFRKVYKVIDAITTKRFMRVRPGISVHYGWLKDVDKVFVSKPRGDNNDIEILLKESGKYEARNLKKPEMKPRIHHGVKLFVIHDVKAAKDLKTTIETAVKQSS